MPDSALPDSAVPSAAPPAGAAAPPIVVEGAREHNLRDISLEIPKNALTVFTGVSGSGKSSLVFATLAQESRRQLNETYPLHIRGMLPRYEKPEADRIADLTPAVVVDQRPPGGNARSTVGTMTDIHPLLRLLFSRAAAPSAGPSSAYSFNTPMGMCPGCEGLGRAVRMDHSAFFDTGLSLNEGAVLFPLLSSSVVPYAAYGRTGLVDPDKPLRDYSGQEWENLLRGGRDGKTTIPVGEGESAFSLTYEGLEDRFRRLYLLRDISTMSKRSRAAVEAVTTDGICADCGGQRLNPAALGSRIDGRSIADLTAMEVDDLLGVLEAVDHPQGTPIAAAAAQAVRRLSDIGLGYLSLDRETATLSGGRRSASPRCATSARPSPGSPTSSTSPAPACTRTTSGGSPASWPTCATAATPSSSWSTTGTSSPPPTTSSTWGRAPARTAARWSTPAASRGCAPPTPPPAPACAAGRASRSSRAPLPESSASKAPTCTTCAAWPRSSPPGC